MKTLVVIDGWDFFRELVRATIIEVEQERKESRKLERRDAGEVEVFGEEIPEREQVLQMVTRLLGDTIASTDGSSNRNNPADSAYRVLRDLVGKAAGPPGCEQVPPTAPLLARN